MSREKQTNDMLGVAMAAAILSLIISLCTLGGAVSKRASERAVIEHRKAQQGARR